MLSFSWFSILFFIFLLFGFFIFFSFLLSFDIIFFILELNCFSGFFLVLIILFSEWFILFLSSEYTFSFFNWFSLLVLLFNFSLFSLCGSKNLFKLFFLIKSLFLKVSEFWISLLNELFSLIFFGLFFLFTFLLYLSILLFLFIIPNSPFLILFSWSSINLS